MILPSFIPLSTLFSFLLLSPLPVYPFSCAISTSSLTYDISPLSGQRTAEKSTDTPPTRNEARVTMNLCSDEGIEYDEGSTDEDQVSSVHFLQPSE
jgi:hypothetical protein